MAGPSPVPMPYPITMTPKDTVDAYSNIKVVLASGTYQVSIVKYRCDNKAFGKDAAHGGTQDAIVFKDRVLGAVGAKKIFAVMSAQEFVGVFLGKGSRDNIVQVLKWCDEKNLLDPKLLKISKQSALQQICDDYIGLDCNGFVGNWANDNAITSIGPSTPPATMGHTFPRNKRATLEDIRPYDILVWNEHVAAVEDIGPVVGGPAMPHRVATVCEAYGAIMCQDRIIRPAGQPGKFQVAAHAWAAAEAYGVGLGPALPLAVQIAVDVVTGAFH